MEELEFEYDDYNDTEEAILKICQKTKLFREISVENIKSIIQDPQIIKYSQGEQIIKENEVSREILYIVKGGVDVTKEVRFAQRKIASIKEGRFFGEIATILQKPRNASIFANTKDTTIFSFRFNRELYLKRPEIFTVFMFNLAEELCFKINEVNGNMKF